MPHAPALSASTFADIDEQAAALTGWNQRYLQVSAGRFRGEVQRLRLDGLGLFIEDLQQSVHQTGHVAPGIVALGVPLTLHGDARFCGEASGEGLLHVFSGEGGFEFRSPQRHLMLGIEIDAGLFESRIAGPAMLDGPAFARRARLQRLDARRMARLRRRLTAWIAQPGSAAVRDAVLEELCRALAGFGEGAPSASSNVSPMLSPSARASVVESARELVRDRLGSPPTVAELCAELGVSRRTLQTAFHEAWGVGPLAWLRLLRLNAVRRALKDAPSVTAAATQLGFFHFGRFSHDYEALFGELPSQTFRQVAGRSR